MIIVGSRLWQYLSQAQRALANDGEFLFKDASEHHSHNPADYSYLVFSFAKLYEGFLKQLFLDTEIISDREYTSDHFRIGKALSPSLAYEHGPNAYAQLEGRYGKHLATTLWRSWKECRNMVFHYFPHNYRALSYKQAGERIEELVSSMEEAVETTGVTRHEKNGD